MVDSQNTWDVGVWRCGGVGALVCGVPTLHLLRKRDDERGGAGSGKEGSQDEDEFGENKEAITQAERVVDAKRKAQVASLLKHYVRLAVKLEKDRDAQAAAGAKKLEDKTTVKSSPDDESKSGTEIENTLSNQGGA